MFCRLQCDLPIYRCNCLPGRQILLAWGYGKLVIDFCLLLWSLVPFVEWTIEINSEPLESQMLVLTIYFVLSTLWMTDILFHIMLVYGVHKDNVKLLRKYNVYSKILWGIMIALVVVYAIVECNNMFYFVDEWQIGLNDRTFSNICIMFVSLIFQTIAVVLVNNETKKLDNTGYISNENDADVKPKANRFTFDFTLRLGTSFTDEEQTDNNVEEIETTCERSKLIV